MLRDLTPVQESSGPRVVERRGQRERETLQLNETGAGDGEELDRLTGFRVENLDRENSQRAVFLLFVFHSFPFWHGKGARTDSVPLLPPTDYAAFFCSDFLAFFANAASTATASVCVVIFGSMYRIELPTFRAHSGWNSAPSELADPMIVHSES